MAMWWKTILQMDIPDINAKVVIMAAIEVTDEKLEEVLKGCKLFHRQGERIAKGGYYG